MENQDLWRARILLLMRLAFVFWLGLICVLMTMVTRKHVDVGCIRDLLAPVVAQTSFANVVMADTESLINAESIMFSGIF